MTVDWERRSPCAESVSLRDETLRSMSSQDDSVDIRRAAPSRMARPIWQKNGGGRKSGEETINTIVVFLRSLASTVL